MITAKEAREISKKAATENTPSAVKNHMAEILKKVKEMSEVGHLSFTYRESLVPSFAVKALTIALSELGYKVNSFSVESDSKYSYMIVSWE